MNRVPDRLDFLAGFWRLADPKITLASMSSILLGAAAAVHDGSRAWGWLALVVAGIFALEWAKNASGEVFDFDSGTDQAVAPADRSPFSGGKRVLVDGLLTTGQTWVIAIVGYAICIAAGLAIVVLREPAVLWLGLAGVALAFFYHAPPLKLSYRGWGEGAVFAAYGPLVCTGTYLVMTQSFAAWVAWLAVPLGLLIAAFLWINEFPDYRADAQAGKRTLVVRLGRPRAARIFSGIVTLAFVFQVVSVALGVPAGALGGLVAIVPAASAARALLAHPEETSQIVPAQAKTLLAFVLCALGAGIGLLLT
ncbi:MAG: prenyltransferase [Burkholderiales bacterium]|jgi:1,4-dihydroxy-2-naphthoate octaprenyltransferase|nr:prenyltransferase [Burkholderiales bacterium]